MVGQVAAGEARSEDPALALVEMVAGFRNSQVVGVVARLGVADELASAPLPVEEVGARLGVDTDNLYRLLRAAATVGILEEPSPRIFALNPLSERLRSGVPGSLRDMAIAFISPGHWLPWGRLEEAVRTGTPQTIPTLGAELFDYYRERPEESQHFSNAMSQATEVFTHEIPGLYDFSPFRLMVDVGGAHGMLLASVLQAYPQLRGILFDLPEVVAGAGPVLEAKGVADRCQALGGDFFRAVPAGDAYLLKWIVHDWPDEKARTILSRCREAMAPGGKVFVIESVLPPDGERSFAHLRDLNMLVLLSAQERTLSEFEALFDAAGLRLEEVLWLNDQERAMLVAAERS